MAVCVAETYRMRADLALDLLTLANFVYNLLMHGRLLIILTSTQKCQSL
jgi:hypothetical protein